MITKCSVFVKTITIVNSYYLHYISILTVLGPVRTHVLTDLHIDAFHWKGHPKGNHNMLRKLVVRGTIDGIVV